MSNALEIKSRTQVVNAKITYAVEVQSVLRDLLTEVRTSYGGYDPPLVLIYEKILYSSYSFSPQLTEWS